MSKKQAQCIVIAAGGSGGHIFPGVAVGRALQKDGCRVVWFGTTDAKTRAWVPADFTYQPIPMRPWRGGGLWRKLTGCVALLRSSVRSLWHLWRYRPAMVITFGGYVTVPVGCAAWLCRIPLVTHEQNSRAGLANRVLSRFARCLLTADPAAYAKQLAAITCGNPVREDCQQVMPDFTQAIETERPLRLLVLGGSQGAQAINTRVEALLAHCRAVGFAISCRHQCGQADYAHLRAVYADAAGVEAIAFIQDMRAAYEWADLVLCRAGAMTLAECAAMAVPSILLPLPTAVDNHQQHNAETYAQNAAAWVIAQDDFEVATVLSWLQTFQQDPVQRRQMAQAAYAQHRAGVTTHILSVCYRQLRTAATVSRYRTALRRLVAEESAYCQAQCAGVRRIHCVGIGGMGMSGLAEWLLAKGYQITGSDTSDSERCAHLRSLGVQIHRGHAAAHVANAQLCVYTSAVTADHVELRAARAAGIPCFRRGEVLAALANEQPNLVVSGTHGKTTTTAMLCHLLQQQGPTSYYVGAELAGAASTAALYDGEICVLESDESDGSFMCLLPQCLIVTNIDVDHLAAYDGCFEVLKRSFIALIERLPSDGLAILCADDPGVQAILPSVTSPCLTYGFSAHADVVLSDYGVVNGHAKAQCCLPDGESVSVQIPLPGQHNILNATAAICAQHWAAKQHGFQRNINFSGFQGVKRRLTLHGDTDIAGRTALLLEDYGHHPREIAVTIDAVRSAWPERRICMVFQPHRYSRTASLWNEFVQVLAQVDCLILLPIYAASEAPVDGVTSVRLAKEIAEQAATPPLLTGETEIMGCLATHMRDNDILLLQGAGSVGSLAGTLQTSQIAATVEAG